MSADPATDLREAAALMREQHGPEHVRHVFWSAVADLLDNVAHIYGHLAQMPTAGFEYIAEHELAIARAYLGRTDD